MYRLLGSKPERKPAESDHRYPYYETYRLRLPRLAMSTIEQIIICKLMLYAYIYHHPKVLSAEGLLVRLLRFRVDAWKASGEPEERIVQRFLTMTDTALDTPEFLENEHPTIADYRYRVQNRLLPRVVFSIGGTLTHAEGDLVSSLTELQDKQKRSSLIDKFETALGQAILTMSTALPQAPRRPCTKQVLGPMCQRRQTSRTRMPSSEDHPQPSVLIASFRSGIGQKRIRRIAITSGYSRSLSMFPLWTWRGKQLSRKSLASQEGIFSIAHAKCGLAPRR